jgi:hypothetical protein
MKSKYQKWDYVTCGPIAVGYITDIMYLTGFGYYYHVGNMWVKEAEIIAKAGNVKLYRKYYE